MLRLAIHLSFPIAPHGGLCFFKFRGNSQRIILKNETNNYKNYDEDIVEKMEMIKAAKEGGFTLAEIKNLLDSWYSKSLSMEKKVAIVANKISEIDNKIRQLKEVKNLLSDCIVDIENGNC